MCASPTWLSAKKAVSTHADWQCMCIHLALARRSPLLNSKLVIHLIQQDVRGLETLRPFCNNLGMLGHRDGPQVSKLWRRLELGIILQGVYVNLNSSNGPITFQNFNNIV